MSHCGSLVPSGDGLGLPGLGGMGHSQELVQAGWRPKLSGLELLVGEGLWWREVPTRAPGYGERDSVT